MSHVKPVPPPSPPRSPVWYVNVWVIVAFDVGSPPPVWSPEPVGVVVTVVPPVVEVNDFSYGSPSPPVEVDEEIWFGIVYDVWVNFWNLVSWQKICDEAHGHVCSVFHFSG